MADLGPKNKQSADRGLKLVSNQAESHSSPRIAIIIPAINEERNIGSVLEDIQTLVLLRPNWEILPIIINDGSTDETEWVLDQIAARYGARVISLPLNLGIGRAVQTGFRVAVEWNADVTLQVDGDGQHIPEEIEKLLPPLLAGMRVKSAQRNVVHPRR